MKLWRLFAAPEDSGMETVVLDASMVLSRMTQLTGLTRTGGKGGMDAAGADTDRLDPDSRCFEFHGIDLRRRKNVMLS